MAQKSKGNSKGKKKHSINNQNYSKPKLSQKKKNIQCGGAEQQEKILYYFIGFLTILVIIYLVYNNYQLQLQQQADLRSKIADVDRQLSELNSTVTRNQQPVFAGASRLENPSIPDIRGVPINVRTRGEPEAYSQLGYLFINNPETATAPTAPPTSVTTETNTINLTTNVNVNTDNNSVLPLYGRRLWNGSDMWNYYILNTNYNQVRLPLTINGKDSMDEYGVKELYDNDTVFVPSQGKTYTVKIYEKDDYRYIPY
jgi:cell division protein FtsL